MKHLALILALLAPVACAHIPYQPVVDCALLDLANAITAILTDLDDWSKLDNDVVHFGKDVFVCAMNRIMSERGTNPVADARAAKARAYMDARGY